MAQFGAAQSGKQEIRKEIGLIGLAHRTSYVMQSTIAHPGHMIEGFIQGLQARRPALFNLYTSCQPEHGIGDDKGHEQARLAVESRAYPLFRYDPERGRTLAECIDLSGNPAQADTWPSYRLDYREGGRAQSMQLPLTFADFAMTEARFRKHFRTAPPDTWHEDMVPLAEFLELDAAQREGKYPYICTVDRRQQLGRLLVDATMVRSTEERRDFWFLLRDLARKPGATAPAARDEAEIERTIMARLTAGLLRLASDPAGVAALEPPEVPGAAVTREATPAVAGEGEGMAPWLDSADCTACDECIGINDAIFAYGPDGKAFIKNAAGGPYSDLVRAAEKCTARVIHPGLPADRSAPDIAKWIERGEKYN